jgi:hypothetical protein
MEYCNCTLPIKMTRKAGDAYKVWYCTLCELPVDPKSKMVDKKIETLRLLNGTKNEYEIQDKINEILELLRSNGSII